MDSVIHFEMPFSQKDRMMKFYSDTFGWEFNPIQMTGGEYLMTTTTPLDENWMPKSPGSINGGMYEDLEQKSRPSVVIGVGSIDNKLLEITENGGEVLQGKTSVNNMGFYAKFRDSEGNEVGLWENVLHKPSSDA